MPRPTDEEILEKALAIDPRIRDSENWPRERVEAVADRSSDSYLYFCRCRPQRLLEAIGPGVDYPEHWPSPTIVKLWGHGYAGRTAEGDWSVHVYLGQCPDCGRIYWGLVESGGD
jgi:hypothetical protein